MPQEEELARRAQEFRQAASRAEALAGELSGRQLDWRPEPGRWSVGDCLEHLVGTGEAYLEVLDRAIREGRQQGRTGRGPFRHGMWDRWLVRLMEPPPGLGLPAPRIVNPLKEDPEGSPEGEGSSAPVLSRFVDLQDRLTERLDRADGLELAGIRLSSPFVSWVRMDLGTAFALVAAHQRRHLWQAEQVTEEEGFPAR